MFFRLHVYNLYIKGYECPGFGCYNCMYFDDGCIILTWPFFNY